MTDRGNYSFSSHNLQTPSMRQSFNRPAKLLQQRQTQPPENRVRLSSNIASGSHHDTLIKSKEEDSQTARLIPHPPSSPRSSVVDTNPRLAALSSKGIKRSRHESPRTSPSGSEDEHRIHKHSSGVVLDPLPMRRRGSTGSLDSIGSTESIDSPRNWSRGKRNLRGAEPLKDIGSGKEIVNSFKSYQNSVKNDHSKKISKKNVVHPMRVTQGQNDPKVEISEHRETTPVESNSAPTNVLNNKPPSEDEVTLSSSNDSLTSVSDSEEASISNSEVPDSRNQELAVQRDPNSTLPTLPKGNHDSTLGVNSSGLYESIHQNEFPQDHNNSTSDLHNLSKALEKVVTNEGKYASDTDLSVRSTGETSNISTLSLLPRVSAQRARTRSGNFLKEEMERYFPDHQIGIFVATWNMHEEKEVPFYLDEFLIPDSTDFLQDLYVVGLQESTSARKEWEIRLQETLGPSHVLMHSCSFGLLHLSVFIRRELVWFCSAVSEDSVSTRVGHMIKTKGALAVSFSIFGTSFLFIDSHFTSDEGKAMDRVNDYKTISKSLSLSPENKGRVTSEGDSTENFDRVFWLGDFNFRVTLGRLQVDEILEKYKDEQRPQCKELQEYDELLDLMEQGKVFVGFNEPPIRFLPSYKHDIQSDNYDSSSKNRVPSWTDRVLYRSADPSSIEPVTYSSCVSVKVSDHRPVFGIYQVKLNPCTENIPLTGGYYMRDVYVEANRRRAAGPRRDGQSAVCVIL